MAFLKKILSPFHHVRVTDTIARFPLCAVCMVGLFLLGIDADTWFVPSDNPYNHHRDHLAGVLVCGFFIFGALRLMGERFAWPRRRECLLTALAVVALGYTFVLEARNGYFLVLFPLSVLLVSVAPFMDRREDDNEAFWLYNYRVWTGAAFAIIAAVLLGGGLEAALMAVRFLFDVQIPHSISKYIWSFNAAIFGPLYALSFVPRSFVAEPQEMDKPRPVLSFILNWLMAPLAILYFIILYAYAGKIAFQMDLPKGEIAYLVTGFGVTGVVIYLVGWPLRNNGTALLRFLYRHFFKILVLPVILLAIAIGTRLSAYGVTESRYLVALALVWFALLCGVFSFKTRPVKWMPLSLVVLLAIALIGPWGAVSLSGYSQTHILKNLLEKNGLLADGKIVLSQDAKNIPDETNARISSVTQYLFSSHRDKALERFFPENTYYASAQEMVKAMGLEFVPYAGFEGRSTACMGNYNEEAALNIRGYSYYKRGNVSVLHNNAADNRKKEQGTEAEGPQISFRAESDAIVSVIEGKGELRFPLPDIIAANPDLRWSGRDWQQLKKPLTAMQSKGALRGKLVFTRLCVVPESEGRPATLQDADFFFLLVD